MINPKIFSGYLRYSAPQDMKQKDAKVWQSLRTELMAGMIAPKSAFIEVIATDVINKNKQMMS